MNFSLTVQGGDGTADIPIAVGFICTDLSAHHAPRHTYEIQRYARDSGYHLLHTVRPPAGEPNPLTYLRGLATEFGAGIIIAFDLGHVNNRPYLLCDLGYRLETVCPHTVWAPTVPVGAAGGVSA